MADELKDLDQKVKKSDKGKWILVIVGVATLIITYRMYRAHQSAVATAASTAGNPGLDPTTGLPAGVGVTGMGTSTPDWSSLSTNLNSLIQSQGALTTALTQALTPPQGSNTTPSYTDVTGEVRGGVGYQMPGQAINNPINTPQGIFQWLSSAPAAMGFEQSGGQLFYQPLPGEFQPTTYANWTKNLGGDTALYGLNPNAQTPKTTAPPTTVSGPIVFHPFNQQLATAKPAA